MTAAIGIVQNRRQQKWITAAAIACLWASSEIVLGSFLHNLKVPMRGTILGFMGVMIVMSMVINSRERGLCWRAGLICALLKSLSPSAVIFGPMVAIFMQGLLMEIVIFVIGPGYIGAMLGGALAILWNLAHLILGYLIYYGNDIIGLYNELIEIASKQFGIENPNPATPIYILIGIYAGAGLMAGFMGTLIARKSRKNENALKLQRGGEMPRKKGNFINTPKPRLIFLLFIPLMVAGLLTAINRLEWFYWAPLWIIAISLIIWRYRYALKRLSKPGFWITFFVITMLSAMLLSHGNWETGIYIGLSMNARAMVLVFAFAAIGRELNHRKVRLIMAGNGKGNFSKVLEACFRTLPDLISMLPPARSFIRRPLSTIASMISVTGALSKRIAAPKTIIITGEKGSGKSTYVNRLVEIVKEKGGKVSGVSSLYFFINGHHEGYDLKLQSDGRIIALARKTEVESYPLKMHYNFDQEALLQGNQELIESANSQADIIVIDEAGILEMNDQGWAPALKVLSTDRNHSIIWVVRPWLIEDFCRKWALRPDLIINTGEPMPDPASIAEAILA